MSKYDIIIIGSGLGGLECGAILSKEGFNVCVVEKNTQFGGCFQTYRRKGHLFLNDLFKLSYAVGISPLSALTSFFVTIPYEQLNDIVNTVATSLFKKFFILFCFIYNLLNISIRNIRK